MVRRAWWALAVGMGLGGCSVGLDFDRTYAGDASTDAASGDARTGGGAADAAPDPDAAPLDRATACRTFCDDLSDCLQDAVTATHEAACPGLSDSRRARYIEGACRGLCLSGGGRARLRPHPGAVRRARDEPRAGAELPGGVDAVRGVLRAHQRRRPALRALLGVRPGPADHGGLSARLRVAGPALLQLPRRAPTRGGRPPHERVLVVPAVRGSATSLRGRVSADHRCAERWAR